MDLLDQVTVEKRLTEQSGERIVLVNMQDEEIGSAEKL